ncbi:hypothetical protein [Nostoc sp. WHI]|uniref:hypothetical protein n=1 Tax=Nostoc sp. WHI TaxID=2650611 RepID=UPI0018C6EC9B|nr:hypothetical protein [Nostoc sp. WHI]MBG1265727.1 hypothetical protein [Nostoc sp. WHI]
MPSLRDATRTAGFAYALWRFCDRFLSHAEEEGSDRTLEILQAIAFLTNHRGAENTGKEESDVEILRSLFISRRGRRERSLTVEGKIRDCSIIKDLRDFLS